MKQAAMADTLLQEGVPHNRRQGKALMFLLLLIASGLTIFQSAVSSTGRESNIGMASTLVSPAMATRGLQTVKTWPLMHTQKTIPSAITNTPLQRFMQPARGSTFVYAYSPSSVADAWKNHFDAFGAQDVEKIALDYDENSRVTVYNNIDGSKSVFKGVEEIKGMFKGLFEDLSDLSTLAAPVIDVDEAPGKGGQVFLVWKCPGCGYDTATDTFIFGSDFKIKFQNIVVTKK